MEMFYNELKTHIRMVVDASTNGTLLDKSYNETCEILEWIANNDYQYPNTRVGTGKRAAGTMELDAITSLTAQVSSLTNMVKIMKRPISSHHVFNAVKTMNLMNAHQIHHMRVTWVISTRTITYIPILIIQGRSNIQSLVGIIMVRRILILLQDKIPLMHRLVILNLCCGKMSIKVIHQLHHHHLVKLC
ncbi:Retrovirus-related Pol polyprotein from transposon 17.6 [Gossypium australe]|uniref:Retrovirus-related Pol polyprotein from transposon 17.6 n=1 Tax=Gossypium australe TaxID=47621 RepID=A0A5B6VNG9_9ROSI|nr:Retrovirus-related Pol polyprotein from transposon 17.6 [Gossypium australe]